MEASTLLNYALLFLLLIYNCLCISNATTLKFCNTENTICEKISENLNNEAALKIEKWIREVSPIKPIKCYGQNNFREELNKVVSNCLDAALSVLMTIDVIFFKDTQPIFSSFECHNLFGSEKEFSFKGEVKDHRFEGKEFFIKFNDQYILVLRT